MIYNNLLYLLVVILILTTSSTPQAPLVPPLWAGVLFFIKALLYFILVRAAQGRRRITESKPYFAAEQRLSILAIIFFAADVYLLDCKYYFSLLPLTGKLPFLADLAGTFLFFFYLCLMWTGALPSYQRIFARRYAVTTFLRSNLKANLPIILPWAILSMLYDLLMLLPFSGLQQLLTSHWGEILLLLSFFVLLALFFPALIRRMWSCTPLPAGPLRSHIEAFCRSQNFTCSEILLWPLFEGQAITAGVMGISRRLRYLLVTPALLNTMTLEELDAIMAHEIGHVKKYHLHLYLVLFLGFALTVSILADPLLYLLLSSTFFYTLLDFTHETPDAGIAFWSTVPLFMVMVIYFRYVFGFFMRNFERQADLHVLTATGKSAPLIRSLEKIGWLSGNIRDLPSWHHFGIGQRVDFLARAARNPGLIRMQDWKVFSALSLYLLLLAAGALILQNPRVEQLKIHSENTYADTVLPQRIALLNQKIRQEPKNSLWYIVKGTLLHDRGQERGARTAYEQALSLDPSHPELLNNLAWLLVTAKDPEVRNPQLALILASQAVAQKGEGYILDTLATAYWANNMVREALRTEEAALTVDPGNRDYYQQQIDLFLRTRYEEKHK